MKASSRIGPYEIRARLGAGGMGEVYRAWDPRLHREVALKLLPDDIASDEARRRRFLGEARAASALTHPNILTVFDVGIDGMRPFIASELIDGRRLSDEIERGALPVRRLLDLGVAIAAGLRAAHDAGIAHCDLKPDNVMISRDGRVKIVDFGLAAPDAFQAVESNDGPPASQTLTATITGTPQYMSPEQARGGRADFRSDQFSFGLMLFEMATGVHPFRRETAAGTMGAIAEDEAPSLEKLNPNLPAVLRWIIERCLAKDPAERYGSTADLAKDLSTLRDRLPDLGRDERPQAGSRRVTRTALVALGALLAGLVGSLLLFPTDTPRETFSPLVTDAAFQGAPAWSPDGRNLAYVSHVDGILQVFTRNQASSQRAQITQSLFDCYDPFWSQDGRGIFYHSRQGFSDSGLYSITAAGGARIDVLENASGATLSPDGDTLAFSRDDEKSQNFIRRSLWFASSDGSGARRYAEPPFGARTFVAAFARFAPDGSKLLLSVWGWSDDPVPVPSPTFWIIPWPTGSPYQVLQSLEDSARTAVAFDWLPDSRHIVAALWDQGTPTTHLWLVDTQLGTRKLLTSTHVSENRPDVRPPDGRRLAFTAEEVDFDLMEIPLNGDAPHAILKTSRNELDPAFAPDGRSYFYVTDRRGTLEIWSGNREDPLGERLVVSANQFPDADDIRALGALAVSPDGQRIVYQRYGRRSGYQIWISSAIAAGPAVELAKGASYQDAPAWSPDGEWIAFAEWRGGDTLRLSKARVGSQEPPELITDDIALYSRIEWSPDGRWILIEPQGGGLAIVSPDGGETRSISDQRWIAYAWTADSKSIYGLRVADSGRHYMLTALELATLQERVVNPDVGEIPTAFQAVRGFSRVGTTGFATSKANAKSAIYVLEGFATSNTLPTRVRAWFGAPFRR